MKLRGIEMQGFKSFADRTKLTFDDGFTAIVGPNGSGKSNVSDAVKWVFGEQSSKSLRGAKMEDVIFGGTQSRKPQGFAWVSLTIDNTDRSIDVDSDEVVITRKLYRSGESEYKINQNPVRLRDIHEIFMDTGLGRDGYSIIEQGKIAEIVSAKSTQRREIFEEAAGISKFRYRKGEAEKRLAQAEENLVRLRDIMGELEGRVGPLRVQSEKAQQFLVYAQEKKGLELSLWLETLEKLRRQTREQEDKILIARSDRNAAQAKLDEIEGNLEALAGRIQDCAVYIDRKRGEIKAVEESLANAQVEIAVKENDMGHNTATMGALRLELENSAGTSEDFDQQIRQKSAQVEAQEAQLRYVREKIEELRRELQEARDSHTALTAEISALEMQREEFREGISKARVSSETSGTLVEETLARLEALRTQAKDKDEHLAALRREARDRKDFVDELTETLESLNNTRSGYQFKLSGKDEKIAQLEEKQRGYEKAAGEKLQRAQVLTDLEKNMEGFSGSVKAVMRYAAQGAVRGVIGPVSSLIAVEKEHSTAVEIAMGAAMQNIVVEDESAAKRSIALLKEQKAGRCTFLPLTTVKGNRIRAAELEKHPGYVGIASELVSCQDQYRPIIESILGRVVIADDIDSAIAMGKSCGHRWRIVTLDGQVVNAGGSLTGGYVAKSASILSRKNEIDRLTADARELSEQASQLESQAEAIRRETAEIRALLDGVDAEYKTANEDLIGAAAELRRVTMAVEEAERLHEEGLREFDALTARVEELKTQKLSSAELIEKLTESCDRIAADIGEAEKKRERLSEEIASKTQLLSDRQVAFASSDKDLEAMRAALENIRLQKEGNATRLDELRAQLAQLEEENRKISGEIQGIRAAVAGSKDTVERLNGEIAAKQKEREESEGETTRLRQQEKELNSQREAAAGEAARLEERLNSINAESDNIAKKMWDEYEMTRTEAAQEAIPIEDSAAAQRRLTELKNKIRALGSVNVAAIEEFKEVSERYYFLRDQIGDVEKSKAELQKLITDLSAQMTRIFLDKFDRIARNFSEIFRELFGGGKGELKLTDPTDALETGIDIYVQPPGKIIKNLASLSGGEQAFVAICIYFAILKVSPAPFVLIDEIEAALDDVNVTKFATYLRKMTGKTQFISITHRRGTMEEADVLYGVTMEEEGVSKLLRLDVGELEEKLKMKL